MPAATHQPSDPRAAFRALVALLADPEDTPQAFRLIENLPGLFYSIVERGIWGTPEGRRLLDERPELLALLSDTQRLQALPAGSLGRAYLDFLRRENITAGGLVEASEQQMPGGGGDGWTYIEERIRDQHDLWHTVLGYEGDVIGEAAILAFSLAQLGNAGMALLVGASLLKQGPFAHTPGSSWIIVKAFFRGLRARWFPKQRWEELLARPLEEVREQLGVGQPPSYAPVHTADLPLAA